jgi:hypothetical protein
MHNVPDVRSPTLYHSEHIPAAQISAIQLQRHLAGQRASMLLWRPLTALEAPGSSEKAA